MKFRTGLLVGTAFVAGLVFAPLGREVGARMLPAAFAQNAGQA
jgi:hypothetical protein